MTTYRLWPSTSGPGAQAADGDNYTLGVEFSVAASGCTLTQVHIWAAQNFSDSDHACRLYQRTGADTGTLVSGSSKAFPAPLVAGWNTVTLDAPVALTSGQVYRACVYFTTDNGYTATADYWSTGSGSAGVTNGPLSAPSSASSADGDQGSFAVGADAYPTGSFGSGNYWIDVTVDDGAGGGGGDPARPVAPIVAGWIGPHPGWRALSSPLIVASPVAVAGSPAELGMGPVGFVGRAAETKVAVETGRAAAGLVATAVGKKVAPAAGRCAVGLTGRRASEQTAAAGGRCTVGLVAAMRPAALPAGIYAGTPTYPAAWVAGPLTYPTAWVAGPPT